MKGLWKFYVGAILVAFGLYGCAYITMAIQAGAHSMECQGECDHV